MSDQRREAIIETVKLIPAGQVATYGQVAQLAGYPGCARLVGKILSGVSDEVPWHRIIRADGSIAERAYGQLDQIEKLRAEGIPVLRNRVNLVEFQFNPLV